ncbi:MAG: ROK family protein [Clostridia bacterium]|jgi:glucokinase
MYYVGVDLGGTNIGVGLVTEDGRIIHKDEVPTLVGRPYEEILKDMADLIIKVVKESGHTIDEVKYIGIGSPGVADDRVGEIVFANNLYWHHVPVRKEIQKYIQKPVYVDNDANVAGLAEFMVGACKGTNNSITITLGTGVGAGIVINKKVFSGSHGVGSELGHMIVEVDGIPCTCGNRGCLERYTSATALIREGKKGAEENPESLLYKKVQGNLDAMNAKIVIDSVKEGDETAVKIFEKYIYYLAMGIITMINSFDPEIIAIGGGVSRAGDFLMDALRKKVKEHIFYKELPYARLVLAELGNDAGIIGAAMLGRS